MRTFWFIGIAAVGYWFLRNKPKPSAVARVPAQKLLAPELTDTTSTGRWQDDGTKVGYQRIADDGFVIGPNLPFPVTLYGLDEVEAYKLATAFELGEDYDIGEWFTHLLAQRNIRCKELDEWVGEAKPKFREIVKQHVLASSEWTQASELDKKNMFIEIQEGAVGELSVRPADLEAAWTLLHEEPHDLADIVGIDLEVLAKAQAYPSQVARVVLRTLRASVNSQRLREPSGDEYADGWALFSEDCCPSCRAQHGKTWNHLPRKLPPFHVGCEAYVYSR